jgi:hypothetical protein
LQKFCFWQRNNTLKPTASFQPHDFGYLHSFLKNLPIRRDINSTSQKHIMGKAGRIACIATPMVLTIISFILLIVVCIGGWNKNDSNLSSLYYFKVSSIASNDSAIDMLTIAARPIQRASKRTSRPPASSA